MMALSVIPGTITLRQTPAKFVCCLRPRRHALITRSQPEGEEVEGDPAVQEALVRTVKLEISKERIREQFEEESDNLRLMAARAKDEVDRWGQLMEDRANLGFNSIIADVNQAADEVEQKLKESRERMEAEKRSFADWEQQTAVDRSVGHFFQSLYQVDPKQPVGGNASSSLEGRTRAIVGQAAEEVRSPTRFIIYSFLTVVLLFFLSAGVASGKAISPVDGVYVGLATLLGFTAWRERVVLLGPVTVEDPGSRSLAVGDSEVRGVEGGSSPPSTQDDDPKSKSF